MMPVWMLLTPKALLLLDVGAAPVVSLYKYLCALLLVVHFFRVGLRAETVKNNYPFSFAFLALILPGAVSVVANLSNANAGVLTLVTLILEVVVPVTIYCHYISQIRSAKYAELIRIYAISACVLAVYGTLCYFIKYNPYIEIIKSSTHTGRIVAQTYEETVRGLRAQGTISHPITYGAVLVSMMYAYLIFKMRKISFNLKDYYGVGAVCLIVLLAVLFSNSRTPVVMYALPIVVFSVLIGGVKSIKYITGFAALSVVGFFTVPVLRDKILSVVNILDPTVGTDQNGSSISMRQEQFATSMKYMNQSPIWGGGLDYSRHIVESKAEPSLYDTESIIYRLMIDQGSLGFVGYILFFILLYWVVAKVTPSRPARVMYFGFVVSYLLFIISTGMMDTLQHVMMLTSFLYYVGKADMRNLQRQGRPKTVVTPRFAPRSDPDAPEVQEAPDEEAGDEARAPA
jgi:hypothetical protein